MGLRYRKSINLGGGFRINLSKSGIGYSWGTKGYRVTRTANGRTRRTTSIPGTGISYVHDSGKSIKRVSGNNASNSKSPTQTATNLHEIESAEVEQFQSAQYDDLLKALAAKVKLRKVTVIVFIVALFFIWFPPVFLVLLALAITLAIINANRGKVKLEYTLDEEKNKEYNKISNVLGTLFQSARVWQIVASGNVLDAKHNAGVGHQVNRLILNLRRKAVYPLKTNISVFSIKLKKQTLCFLPEHILLLQKSKFGVLEYKALNVSYEPSRFVEKGVLPKDAEVIDYTWQFVNKNGSPDRRYTNNRRYPVCKYGSVHITTQTGLHIELQCSNSEKAIQFSEAFKSNQFSYSKSVENEIVAGEDWRKVEEFLKTNFDDKICDALRLIIGEQIASTSFLQRKLGLGYARSARLMDLYAESGIIGPFNGSQPRTVIMQEYIPAVNQIVQTLSKKEKQESTTSSSAPAITGRDASEDITEKNVVKKGAEALDVNDLLSELEQMEGLQPIKEEIQSMVNLIKVRKMREANHLPNTPMSLHMVFTGNPGTGKTTVARLLSRIYKGLGVLSGGQMIEVDRSSLVAGYVGQTALKTSEIIQKALGGILFIDEAYSLTNKGENDFGDEAIETILKAMEDNRDNLVVIVAGYQDLMNDFINSNPGLKSRFNKYLNFEDYDAIQLYHIFITFCKKDGYDISDSAIEVLKNYFSNLYEHRDQNFANARDVRNSFEKILSIQANRLSQLTNPLVKDLKTIQLEDVNSLELK